MENKKIVIILSLFVIMFLEFNFIFGAEVQKYQQQLEDIKEQQRQNANKLSGVEKDLAQYMYEMLELDSKMVKYSTQLAELQSKVNTINSKLSEQEDLLQNASQSYNTAEDMYTTRLRAIYENGIPSIIDVLFTSKGIVDFFSRMNVYTSIIEYDKSLVGNMKKQKEYIDYIKQDVGNQKLQLEQLKYDTEKSTKALEDTVDAKNAKISQLNSSKSNLEEQSKLLQKRKEEADKNIEKELQKAYEEALANKNTPIFADGEYAWPVNGYYTITTRYNAVYDPFSSGKKRTHTGTDIAGSGISGKPIFAMQSGSIRVPPFQPEGYGNYVIISHGKSSTDGSIYTSLYGHMSSIAVVEGQYVKKGQVIGYVGTTGYSTGSHLHLEATRDGKRFDALTLFPSIKFNFI